MSGDCWNYMNDSAANEILGYHIYVGYGMDSERHEKNYRMVVRENPLGDPEIYNGSLVKTTLEEIIVNTF